ncbi:hypothetical protein LTS18_003968, partial [Coniosporium uncinatum]
DETASHRSGSIQESGKGGKLKGLKRLGTVLGRTPKSKDKKALPYGRPSSPERKSSSNLGATFSSFGRSGGRSRDAPPTPSLPRLNSSRGDTQPVSSSPPPRLPEPVSEPVESREIAERPNGALPTFYEPPTSDITNGTQASGGGGIPDLPEPLQPTSARETAVEPERDAEGFSVPPSSLDAISRAEQEAAAAGEDASSPQFKLDIRNAPIQEEDAGAEAALANVASALRAQAAPAKRASTIRGRRDVRNTIFVPSPQTPDLQSPEPILQASSSATPPLSAPASAPNAGLDVSPFKLSHRGIFLDNDLAASDTHSIRSARSFTSTTSQTIKHPDMHFPGLNASIIDTVSAWFEGGAVTKTVTVGEVALAFNPTDISSPFGTKSIRLDNFQVLEKVAPNPVFIEALSDGVDKQGYYTVNLSNCTKTSVAFKYQVHMDSSNNAAHVPLLLNPQWKVEPSYTSVIMTYSFNPSFIIPNDKSSITLSNVLLFIHLDPTGARATAAKSMPAGGTFSKERQVIYWKYDELTLARDSPPQHLKARFFTESEAKPGATEARWEIGPGEQTEGLGSALGLSVKEDDSPKAGTEDDPFADEGEPGEKKAEDGQETWRAIAPLRKIRAGTYSASAQLAG